MSPSKSGCPRGLEVVVAYIRRRPRVEKLVPAAPGKVLFKSEAGGEGFLVWWKFKTKRPPTPKRWVTLIVFLADHQLRRRSYRVKWNGDRVALDEVAEKLGDRHPEVMGAALEGLEVFRERLIRRV